MKKLSDLILENTGNIYQEGTPFSNGHRSRRNGDGFLLDKHIMIDIDEVVFDANGKIWAILENKKRTPGSYSKLKNILTETTSQKQALSELCKLLQCHFFVQIELEETYHLIENLNVSKTFTKSKFDETILERKYSRLKTDNIVFVEFRNNPMNFISIDTRISEANNDVMNFAKSISNILGVPNVEVDDSGEFISFFNNGTFVGKVKSVKYPKSLSPLERKTLENDWTWIYNQIGIFN